MADQDPSNLNNDKFTLTLSDGATRPPNILGSPQIPEIQTITQTSPNLPTLPHTQEINAEAALSSLSTTPDDTVTSQDTALITPSLAHDATELSMTPPTASTLDSDGAAMSTDSNQASKDLSQLPNPEAILADTQQNVSPPTASTLDSDGAVTTADSNQASKDLSQLPNPEAVSADTQRTGGGTGKKRRRRRRKRPLDKDSIQSDSGSMEAFGDIHQGRTYELENANDNISDLTQRLTKPEIKTVTLNQELEKGNTESANLKQQIETLVNEKASLKEELAKGKNEISTLEEKLENAEHKIVNDEFDKWAEIGGWQQKLRDEIADWEKKLKDEGTMITGLRKDITGLRRELDSRTTALHKANQARDNEELQNADLNKELAKERTEINKLKQEIGKFNSEKPSLNQELDKAKSEITNLKQEVKSLADQKSKLERATDTVADGKLSLKEQVSELESVNKRLEQERNKLQNELEREKDQQRGKDNEMETQYATIQQQKESLESQNVDLTKLAEDLVKKEDAINHANDANTKLEEKIKTLEHRVSTQSGQVKGSEKQMWATRIELKDLKALHERTTKELQSTVERLTMRVENQPKSKVNEMKQEFAASLEANKQFEIEIEMLRTQISGLEEELFLVQRKHERAAKKMRRFHGHTDEDDAEAAEEKAGAAGEKAATAGEKAEIAGDKADAAHEKADAAKENAGAAGEHAETAGKKAETSEEKIKTPYENQGEKQEAAGDVPTVEYSAVARNHEPAVTMIEEPKLPSAEVEVKGQGSKTGLFELTQAEISEPTGLHRGNGNSSGTTEAETVIDANALAKAEHPHKQIPQEGDPFTEARVSLKAPAELFDPDYDVSDSSVCSTTELSIDNQTPRALRRPLGQEGIHSRRHSTATNLSVTKVEKWINRISKSSNYVEKDTQTDNMVSVDDMGVQTEDVAFKKPMVLVEDMGVQTEDVPVKMPMVLVKDMGVQTEEETPKFRQTRRYLLMSSFIHLLLLLFYLGMFYLAWSSWAETTAERDLWTRTNSALKHGPLLFENGSYPPSAISEIFYRKM